MKPNLFFLTIDSLRADKIYGPNKSSLTPNIDSLIEKGAYFAQTISTSDATGLSLGSIFTASYPFKTGITHFTFNSEAPNHLNLLKKNGYNTYATVPDVSFFLKLTADIPDTDAYVYDKRESWVQLVGGIGDMITNRLSGLKEPWAYYVHIMDLHAPFYLPQEFDSEKYGKTRYDRMVSAIDFWIGKFLQKIDQQKTLIVITADHGDYIPITDENPKKQGALSRLLRLGKKIFPALEPLGLKIYIKINSLKKSARYNKLKKSLTEDELRTMDARGHWSLYDELVRTPLIFSWPGTIQIKKIPVQVRQIDIFPTMFDLLKIANLKSDIDGTSLLPIIEGKNTNEIPAYIETGSRDPKKLGNMIGIRTPHYKYFRARDNPKERVFLFDLKIDPLEKTNIANNKPELVAEMENMLEKIKGGSTQAKPEEINDAERRKIEEELKKLGYL